jgi:DNA-binding beta-propeller fold protein YncE
VYPLIGVEGEKSKFGEEGGKEGQIQSSASAVLDPTCKLCLIADGANHRMQVFDFIEGKPLYSYGKMGKGPNQFRCPSGVCVVQLQNAVRTAVTDMLNHRVHIFDGTGPKTLSIVGSKGAGDGQLLFPRGIAANEDGEIYVCDQGNHRICVFNVMTGQYLRKFGSRGIGNGQFNTPLSVAVDVDGRVLVSDKNHRVQVFDKQGTFLFTFGGKGSRDGQFRYPAAVAVDDEGSIFVCDSSNARVQVFSPDGKFVHKWGGHKGAPVPVAEDEEGDGGEEAPEPKETWEGMKKPMGIALARDGTIWVVDHELNQILVY